MSGNKELGMFEAPLFDYINQGSFAPFMFLYAAEITELIGSTDTEFPIEIKHVLSSKAHLCALKVQLTLDASDNWSPNDDTLQDAGDRLQNVLIGQSGKPSPVKTTKTALLEALEDLDQLVKVVDDLTEVSCYTYNVAHRK